MSKPEEKPKKTRAASKFILAARAERELAALNKSFEAHTRKAADAKAKREKLIAGLAPEVAALLGAG